MVKSKSYSPFRYAPWCFRDLLAFRLAAASVVPFLALPFTVSPVQLLRFRLAAASVVPSPVSRFNKGGTHKDSVLTPKSA